MYDLCGAFGGQQRATDILALVLQAVASYLMWELEIERGSSGKEQSSPNYTPISPALFGLILDTGSVSVA